MHPPPLFSTKKSTVPEESELNIWKSETIITTENDFIPMLLCHHGMLLVCGSAQIIVDHFRPCTRVI